MRVVVHDGSGEVPSLDVENTGRPPEDENAIPSILGGLDPNLPSSREVLESDALAPERIVDEGSVPAAAVIAEHRVIVTCGGAARCAAALVGPRVNRLSLRGRLARPRSLTRD